MKKYYLTSESVTEGHPDKICDKISDYILDEALRCDKHSKMAVEVSIKDDLIFIFGEANTKANLNYEELALKVIKDIGYSEKYNVIVKVGMQSNEINNAVCKNKIMAGDQGIMFGYACDETTSFMPLSIQLANNLARRLSEVRKENENSILLPDGKTQVTVEYIDGKISRIDTIIIACQHKSNAKYEEIYNLIKKEVIDFVVPKDLIDSNTKETIKV